MTRRPQSLVLTCDSGVPGKDSMAAFAPGGGASSQGRRAPPPPRGYTKPNPLAHVIAKDPSQGHRWRQDPQNPFGVPS